MNKPLRLLVVEKMPILYQLQLEEALLRLDDQNWCIINRGSTPAIVFGISGKIEDHTNKEEAKARGVSLIRRYSGGGTVIVDENTFFVSFIMQKEDIGVTTCPKQLLHWTEKVYSPVFIPHQFKICENDYVLGNRKIGGNAQYFTKSRCVHHTTFLWSFSSSRMALLKMPPQMPEWREGRSHADFIDSLERYYPSMTTLEERLIDSLKKEFTIQEGSFQFIQQLALAPHRKTTEELI